MRLVNLFASILLSSCLASSVMSAPKATLKNNSQRIPTSIIMKHNDRSPLIRNHPTFFDHLAEFFKPRSRGPLHGKSNTHPNSKVYKVFGKTYHVLEKSGGYKARGIASWYGSSFHRKKTSSGDRYNMYAMTAAHKTLPLPTYVRVRNLSNGREVIVKVNDRGPFYKDRIIDLSYAAGVKLGLLVKGTALVEVEALPRSFMR